MAPRCKPLLYAASCGRQDVLAVDVRSRLIRGAGCAKARTSRVHCCLRVCAALKWREHHSWLSNVGWTVTCHNPRIAVIALSTNKPHVRS